MTTTCENQMIDGKITTYEYKGGDRLYVGYCTVADETVTAADVMSAQIPSGPMNGSERVTLTWVSVVEGARSRCEFRIVDRKRTS